MPQLNPAPWFLILLLSWTVLLLIFKTKILTSAHYNAPLAPDLLTPHTTPWNWPWI
uniref:ATP synthase complex subunit 8 n=1 Tax=Plestiodon tunganus TaxID=463550 RepID=A0A5Q0RY68_9SAUR|nr:ATP synthase F0 subunit 8 [Plestiodon tunganus]QGA46909.1 ATP synthase F0 subunit 8 [Plestiodon tunganus]